MNSVARHFLMFVAGFVMGLLVASVPPEHRVSAMLGAAFLFGVAEYGLQKTLRK